LLDLNDFVMVGLDPIIHAGGQAQDPVTDSQSCPNLSWLMQDSVDLRVKPKDDFILIRV
jgi:hypothetical protein